MLPSKITYPHFVPDQLLTSDNLNSLFEYLDEQGRLTCTNLIGIGIVCGLDVVPSADGTSITITKGTGVTSQGYKVSIPQTTYTQYRIYDPDQEKKYEPFLNPSNQAFWELTQTAVANETTPLSYNFLNGNGEDAKKKAVLLFVELLEVENKNCNPNSCDDKGITVEVNIRPILVEKSKTSHLLTGTSCNLLLSEAVDIKPMKMKRFDVPNTGLASTYDVFYAFKNAINSSFIGEVENRLLKTWQAFGSIVGDEYGNINPFSGFANSFKFLHDGTITLFQLNHIQYYYDFFSDLLQAYHELRETGLEALAICTPDSSLFPRHLMLDLALPDKSKSFSSYRHCFIYSPLFQHKHLILKLKGLFRRLVLMIQQFSIPPVQGSMMKHIDPYQRITPSKLDDSLLSEKAIPYYYNVNQGPKPLFQAWNFEKTVIGEANQNLSYHAAKYGGPTDALNYDLECYNFLRVEGIVGKSYTHVLANLKKRIHNSRLPVDVIAINTDTRDFDDANMLKNLTTLTSIKDSLGDIHCHFNDLEAMYDSLRNEILCMLCQELRYYYEIPLQLANLGLKAYSRFLVQIEQASDLELTSKVKLFEACYDTPYLINKTSMGTVIEWVYRKMNKDENLSASVIQKALDVDPISEDVSHSEKHVNKQLSTRITAAVAQLIPILEIPILIIRLSELLKESLHDVDINLYCKLHAMISERIRSYKTATSSVESSDKEAIRSKLYEKIQKKEATTPEAYVPKTTSGEAPTPKAESREAISEKVISREISRAELELFEIKNKELIQNEVKKRVSFSRIESQLQHDDIQLIATTQSNIGAIMLFLFVKEDLFDHFDALIYNCKCSALKTLKQEYIRRVKELAGLRQLKTFSQHHPGYQHKAGVTMCGTLIILYHLPSELKPLKKMDQWMTTLVDQIQPGTVIADFYIPCLCYSPCPPIVYHVTEIEQAAVPVTLSLQPNPKTGTNIYDVGDENTYSFTHTPESGSLNNGTEENGVKETAENQFIFEPGLLAEKIQDQASLEMSFSFTSEGETSSPIAVKVFSSPSAQIVMTPNQNEIFVGATINFKGIVSYADTVIWTLKSDRGLFTVGNQADLGDRVFEKPGTYVMSLSAIQSLTGAVSDPAAVTLTVLEKPSAVITSDINLIEKPEVAQGQVITFAAEVTNADEYEWYENNTVVAKTLDLPPRTYNNPGEYVIKLKAIHSASGEFVFSNELTFTVIGKVTAKITSTPPIIEENPVQLGSIVTFNGQAEHADQYRWFRNNVIVSSKKDNVKIQFDKSGLEVITFKATNSHTGDAASDVLNITVRNLEEKTCEQCKAVGSDYRKLKKLDEENFNAFKKLMLDEWGISSYISKLIKVCRKDEAAQLEFFTTGDETLSMKIIAWLKQIKAALLNGEFDQFRVLLLELYRILAHLAMYAACFQTEDIDKAQVNVLPVFQTIKRDLKGATGMWALRKTKLKADPQPLERLKRDVIKEKAALAQNGETATKPKYNDVLNDLIKIMT